LLVADEGFVSFSLCSEFCSQLPEDIIHFSLESIRQHEMTIVFTILNIENIYSERNKILSSKLIENSVVK